MPYREPIIEAVALLTGVLGIIGTLISIAHKDRYEHKLLFRDHSDIMKETDINREKQEAMKNQLSEIGKNTNEIIVEMECQKREKAARQEALTSEAVKINDMIEKATAMYDQWLKQGEEISRLKDEMKDKRENEHLREALMEKKV